MGRPSIEFEVVGNKLHLIYRPHEGPDWVYRKFKSDKEITIKGTFHLSRFNLVRDDVDGWVDDDYALLSGPNDSEFDSENRIDFLVADSGHGEYFRFSKDVLPIGIDVLLHRQETKPTLKWFVAEKNISVLEVIAQLKPSRIVIGGAEHDSIPVADYERLINQFPSPHELKKYTLARVATVIREYTDATVDAEAQLRKTVDRKVKSTPKDLAARFRAADIQKYEYLLQNLKNMLARGPNTYNEASWQDQIIQIICLLNPKYIEAFTTVRVRASGRELRIFDILLVDASGNVDVLEIKKPFDKAMVTNGFYRKNHVPLRELSGAVIQVEKYLLHLSQWGTKGEEFLTEKYSPQLPPGFKIKIVNPCGLIIMGRDCDMTTSQRHDFEVVRRHYKHIADIVTYDDLVRRLEAVLAKLKTKNPAE